MNITLKGYKHFSGMDGECFSATICFDGKAVGTVTNEGMGGPNHYSLNGKNMAVLVKAANEAGHKGAECEDVFIEEVLEEMSVLKAHRKHLKQGLKFTAWVRLNEFENGIIGLLDKKNLQKYLTSNKATLIKLFE